MSEVAGNCLAVSGLARTPLAKSVADACWSIGVRLLVAEGVALPPAVADLSGWFPSSRLCSGWGAGWRGRSLWRCGPGPAPRVASPATGI